MQASFKAAGVDIFTGQGKTFVTVNGQEVISHGKKSSLFDDLPNGVKCIEERQKRGWSQRVTARFSNVSQPKISSIERGAGHYYLTDLVQLKKTFAENKP